MKIAINTLAMKSYKHGMGRYIGSLVNSLLKVDQKNQYLLYVSKVNAKYFETKGNSQVKLKFVSSNRVLRLLWEQMILPWDLRKEQVDVFFGPAYTVPLIKTCKQIVTILDLTWFKQKEKNVWVKQFYFRNLIPLAIKQSEKIVVISQSTKSDLMNILKVPERKMFVTYLAVDSSFQRISDEKRLLQARRKYSLPEKFILFLGVIEPKKNISGLVTAYERLKRETDLPHKLVIGGGKSYGWKNKEVFKKVKDLKMEKEVIFTDFVSEKDLPTVYNLADLFVLPSFYEGFGLPILEAQACGCPVITSNVSSMPEVGGDAAHYIDPYNINGLALAMQRILTDGKLREEMIKKGFENVRRFSWEKTAQETLEVFKKVYFKKGENYPVSGVVEADNKQVTRLTSECTKRIREARAMPVGIYKES